MKKLITLLLFTSLCYSQVTLNVYQDVRLAVSGDDYGNDSGTVDLVIKSEWRSRQKSVGYWFMYPQYEYADLYGGTYERYCAGVGFGFNKFTKIIDFSPSVNWGILDRFGRSFFTFEVQGDLSFRISKRFRFSIMGTVTERKDLDYMEQNKNAHNIQFNTYAGLKFVL